MAHYASGPGKALLWFLGMSCSWAPLLSARASAMALGLSKPQSAVS